MFLKEYYSALTTGKPKEAFDAGKTLSDIIAMANRAFWLLAFALVVTRALANLGSDAQWYETLAMWTCIAVFGWILPAVLGVQILLIAFRSLSTMKEQKWQCRAKIAVFFTMAFLISAVNFSWTAIDRSIERQEIAKRQLDEMRERNK